MRKSKKWIAAFLATVMLGTSFSGLQMTAYANDEEQPILQLMDVEIEPENEPESELGNEPGKIYTLDDELPSAVDISKDEYFPPVGDQSFNGNCGYWSSYYHNFTYSYNKKHGIKTTIDTCHNPIFGFAFYGRSLESDQDIAKQIGYPTMGALPLDHYGTNSFSPTKEVWEDAIKHRTNGFTDYKRFGNEDSVITGPDDPSLKQIKMLLANDLIVGIGTLSGKWNITTITEGKFKGESIIDRCDLGGLGGHGISFVGYDDDIWVDINHDGQKQTAEYGAFKMVNSWGPDWGNGGFIWVSYDAVNPVSQAISSADQTRINNSIATGALKCNKVNNSDRMSFIWFESVSTLNLREKETSGCICYITVNTGSRTEMRMSLTATSKKDGKSTTYNFPSLVHDDDHYAWDGTSKATDATMAFDLDNLFADISADKLEDYTWKATFGDTLNDNHSLVVKDVYIAADGVKKYVTAVSKIPLNGSERTYDLKSVSSGNLSDSVIEAENKSNVVIYYNNSSFKDANIHYRVGNGTWTKSPGVQMCTDGSQDGYIWKYIINLGKESQLTACFNNGSKWDSNGGSDYVLKAGCYGIKDGKITELKEVENIPEESIKLDKTSLSLYEEETATLTATVSPANATDKSVTWTTSDKKIATVNNGVVTAVSQGSAVITATTVNGYKATVNVKVSVNPNIVKPTEVLVIVDNLYMVEGDDTKLTATVEPVNATNKTLTWASADTNIATVENGYIKAISVGTTTITATATNGVKKSINVVVKEKTKSNGPSIIAFEKPSTWGENIHVYMWDDSNNKQYQGAWPGTAIKKYQGFENLYVFEYSSDNSNMMIIFNDGINNHQTKDLKFVNNGYYDVNGYVKLHTVENPKGKVTVECVDEKGNLLLSKTMHGDIDSEYSITEEKLNGYTLKTKPTNVTGKYSATETKVKYIYSANKEEIELSVKAKAASSFVKLEDKVTITANATGGDGNYKYSFIVKNTKTGEWARVANKITANSYTWTANTEGARWFYVDVTDGTGKTVRSDVVKLDVIAYSTMLSASLKASTTNTTVGNTVKLTATGIDGEGSYKYSYIVHNKTTGKWARLADKVKSNTYSWKAGSAGTRVFYVDVTDASGKTVRSNAITIVTKNQSVLTIKGQTSATNVYVGENIKITGNATGGDGPYTYSFVVHNKTANKWHRFNFSSSNVLSWKATSKGTRLFYIEVKDKNGKVVRSEAVTITVK